MSITPHPLKKNISRSTMLRPFLHFVSFFWVNSGDHDMIVPFLGTQAWIRSLGYPLIDDWRPWMIGDQIAGYITLSLLMSSIVIFILLSYEFTRFTLI